jgi:hypothetical protein
MTVRSREVVKAIIYLLLGAVLTLLLILLYSYRTYSTGISL